MNYKIFQSYQKKAAFLGILSISFFSFSLLDMPAYANEVSSSSTNNISSVTDTTTAKEIETNKDLVIIDDIIFQLSTASSETLEAYQNYQKAISYQNEWNMILVNKIGRASCRERV